MSVWTLLLLVGYPAAMCLALALGVLAAGRIRPHVTVPPPRRRAPRLTAPAAIPPPRLTALPVVPAAALHRAPRRPRAAAR